jgi:hypothetical protein
MYQNMSVQIRICKISEYILTYFHTYIVTYTHYSLYCTLIHRKYTINFNFCLCQSFGFVLIQTSFLFFMTFRYFKIINDTVPLFFPIYYICVGSDGAPLFPTGGQGQDPDLPRPLQGRLRLCPLGLLQHPARRRRRRRIPLECGLPMPTCCC